MNANSFVSSPLSSCKKFYTPLAVGSIGTPSSVLLSSTSTVSPIDSLSSRVGHESRTNKWQYSEKDTCICLIREVRNTSVTNRDHQMIGDRDRVSGELFGIVFRDRAAPATISGSIKGRKGPCLMKEKQGILQSMRDTFQCDDSNSLCVLATISKFWGSLN